MTTPDDDAKALGEAGYEVVTTASEGTSLVYMGTEAEHAVLRCKHGDLVVRRKRPPAAVESECVRMFTTALRREYEGLEISERSVVDDFKAALAREIEAAERRAVYKHVLSTASLSPVDRLTAYGFVVEGFDPDTDTFTVRARRAGEAT